MLERERVGSGNARPWSILAAAIVGVVTLCLVGILVTRKSATERADYDPLENQPAPAIVGTTLDGKPFDIDGLRGKWVVLNFFATWCEPCQAEHPDLVSFSQRHAEAGNDSVQLVSVVFNDDLNAVREYYAKNGGDWPVVNGDEGRMALDYSVIKVPDTYIIDPFGVVRARIPRQTSADELDATIGGLSNKLFPTTTVGSGPP